MSGELLLREARWRSRNGWWLVASGPLVGLLALSLAAALETGEVAGLAELTAPQGARAARAAILAETAWIVVAAPALTIRAWIGERVAGTLSGLFLSPWSSTAILSSKLAFPIVAAVLLVLGSALPLFGLAALLPAVSAAPLAQAQLQLGAVAAAALALGLLGSTVFSTESAAAGFVYALLALASAAPVLAGPVIAAVYEARPLITVCLLVSPFSAVASALGFDLMRTEWMYRLTPVGQRDFSYPPPWATAGFFLASALLVLFLTLGVIAAERRSIAI